MPWYPHILHAIGNTPMVQLNRVTQTLPATVLAKVETFNPGHSTKDRMALKMIEEAEKSGKLKPGGTIIEGTSGNTGMGLAIAAIVKGYQCIFTTTDKQSKEKVDALRALGAEVVVCPTNVDPEDPRSYYSVSSRLEREIPNSWKANQYDNLSNRLAHYESTGPEIWAQTEGRITHLVVGVGTGGTISGTARYLKEQNPAIQVWGIDTYGSVFKKYKETGVFDKNEIYPYITEGIGEDFLPQNVDFDLIDRFEKVTDRDAAVMTRRIAREEGIFAGNSAGSAVAGLLQLGDHLQKGDVVVIIFHDHGTRYLGKMFNDEWMRERGFLESPVRTAADCVAAHRHQPLLTVGVNQTVAEAVQKMLHYNVSQLPVVDAQEWKGSVTDHQLMGLLAGDEAVRRSLVGEVMLPPFACVSADTPVSALMVHFSSPTPAAAVLVDLGGDEMHIITRHDLMAQLS